MPNYRRRRLMVAGVGVALVLAFVLGMVEAGLWVRDTIRDQERERAAGSAKTVYPQPRACVSADLDTLAQAPAHQGVGQTLTVSLTVRNRGGEACLLDVGSSRLALVLTSGDQVLLDSAVCPVKPTSHRLLVGPGDAARVDMTWDGMVGTAQCLPSTGGATSSSEDPDAGSPTASSGPAASAAASAAPSAPATATAPAQGSERSGQASREAEGAAVAATPTASGAKGKTGEDAHVTTVSVLGRGGYAQAGVYTLQVRLAGQDLGPQLPLVLG